MHFLEKLHCIIDTATKYVFAGIKNEKNYRWDTLMEILQKVFFAIFDNNRLKIKFIYIFFDSVQVMIQQFVYGTHKAVLVYMF